MLSVSPDDHPVIGNLRNYPNVFVNIGHGQRSSSLAFISGKIISDSIDGTNSSKIDQKLLDNVNP